MVPLIHRADSTPISGKWLAVSSNRSRLAFFGFKVRAEALG